MTWGCNQSNAALTRALAEPGLNIARSAFLQKEEQPEAHHWQKLMGNLGFLKGLVSDSQQHVKTIVTACLQGQSEA